MVYYSHSVVLLIPGKYFLHLVLAEGDWVGQVGFFRLDEGDVTVGAGLAVPQRRQQKERGAVAVVDGRVVQRRPRITAHTLLVSLEGNRKTLLKTQVFLYFWGIVMVGAGLAVPQRR